MPMPGSKCGGEEKSETEYTGFHVSLREITLNICMKQAKQVNVTLLLNLSIS